MPGMDKQGRGSALIALAGVLWGLNGLYVHVLSDAGLGPLSIVFVRYVCALAVLAPAVSAASAQAHRDILALRPEHIACCVGLGLFSNALGGVLSAYAIARVGISVTTVLLYTAPVFGCLLSWRLYGEELGTDKLGAIACNFVGVVLVVAGGGALQSGASPLGLVAALGYGITYSLLAVLSRPVAGVCHPLAVIYYGSLTAAAALALPAIGSGELPLVFQPLPAIATLLYGGVSTVLANILYQRGMTCGVEISRVPVITSVEVAVSACVGTIVFGETLSIGKVMGICGVLASIILMNAHVAPGMAHGVRLIPTAEQLKAAYGTSMDLGAAVTDLRHKREDAVGR